MSENGIIFGMVIIIRNVNVVPPALKERRYQKNMMNLDLVQRQKFHCHYTIWD